MSSLDYFNFTDGMNNLSNVVTNDQIMTWCKSQHASLLLGNVKFAAFILLGTYLVDLFKGYVENHPEMKEETTSWRFFEAVFSVNAWIRIFAMIFIIYMLIWGVA